MARRVHLIATGGTIASSAEAHGGARATLTGADLVRALPALEGVAEVAVEQFSNVASQQLSLQQLVAIGRRASAVLAGGAADGVVITQGTMTIEESAYLWQLMLGGRGPVVVTGAMRHTSLPGSDGPRNLLDAIVAAASGTTRAAGVLVCMNGELHAARDVVKTHTLNVDAFRSPDLGPLGFVRAGRVELHRLPAILESIAGVEATEATVALVTIVAGDDGGLIEAAVQRGVDGLVLETLGGGAVPPACMPAIAQATARIPVVAVSRCHAGPMYEGVYASPGGDMALRQAGVILGGSLTGPKARIKLILALGAHRADREKLRAMFTNV